MSYDDDITMIPNLTYTSLYPYYQPVPREPLQTWPPTIQRTNSNPYVYNPHAPGPSNPTRIIHPLPNTFSHPRFLPPTGLSEASQSPAGGSSGNRSDSPAVPSSRRKPTKPKPRSQDEALLAPDYSANPAGPASDAATIFKCSHCDKTYKGKHGRSIWRRHLSSKHNIPLSNQPRRTRWDNDANRPQNEVERKARTLESKRKWAQKHRAEERSSSVIDGDEDRKFKREGSEDDDDDEEGEEDWEDVEPIPEMVKVKAKKVNKVIAPLREEEEDSQQARAGSAPIPVALLKKDEKVAAKPRPGLRTSISMGYVEPHSQKPHYSPYDMPIPPYPQQSSQQQYHHRAPPQQSYIPQYAPQQVRPENHYSQSQPYYPPPPHGYSAEEMQHAQTSYYALAPGSSGSQLRGVSQPSHSISHSVSAPNLSHSRESAISRGPAVYSTSSAAYSQQRQPDFSHSIAEGFSNDTALYKGLLPQPYRGGATEAQSRNQEAERGESNEDAACVLMALKKGCSSPIAPGYYSVPKYTARPTIAPSGVGESSLEEDDPSFVSFTGRDERRLADGLEGTSPPSSTTSDSEIRHTTSLASRLPKRAASESPPLSNLRESPKKSRAAGNNMVKVGKYTSLVATPTPGFKGGMESSPALERSVLSQRIIRGERLEEEEEEEEEIPKVAFIRSRRIREESHSPTTSGPAKKGKSRAMIGSLLEKGSSPAWLPEDQSNLIITSATLSNSSLLGEMLPPHPGSSSSIASFVPSTPAGPTLNNSLQFKTIYNSTSQQKNSISNSRTDGYSQIHINPFTTKPYQYLGPNSSPPSGFLFSSPAHPGISKQLGLSATPGPGVSAFDIVEEKDEGTENA